MLLPARRCAPVLLVAFLLAGCAVSGSGDGRATAAGSPTAAKPVTAAAYRAAINDFLGCMKAHGYETIGPALSPVDNRALFRDVIPKGQPATFNNRLDGCEKSARLSQIEPTYMEQHPPVMAPALRPDAAKCLADQGVTAKGGERDYNAFVRSAKSSSDFGQCLAAAVRRRYPELPPRITIMY